ncbi:MAG TPA: HPr(Ser) kinase/phosphatase [Candidatus Paceibacterota bacterium]|nr:HPr(Ser) kinase/phosphatase [Verrucomicrobiota bacterium]HOX02506.1 HPr(Ser) kinase/phosphatase [Verrucomicrobiota bacterium]HRZ45431.1 HPr(Ser) kinase/phosphatase [Candidatus Paceibacterota bacterium]HRZ92373.1 HPr(Ser) kinase/phosphatase [Candidatus Paceibacterota bacterium]
MQRDIVTVDRFFREYSGKLGLELLAGSPGLKRFIREPTINRPGLALAGFTRYFASKRIQVIGSAEATFLKSLSSEQRERRYAELFAYRIPCVVVCRRINPDRALLDQAEKAQVPVFKCPLITMKFINLATLALETMFAPHGTEMGSMVDIHGVGVIIRGESGIGKSECVLELIERGYSLISDDITRLTVLEGEQLIGSSPPLTQNMMEVRGIGIINVAAMFGIKSIRPEKQVDLVVTLRQWEEVMDVDRLGMDEERIRILGVSIPHVVLPVRPGRNLARLVEVAALQVKLRASGVNAARDLNNRLIAQIAAGSPHGPAPGA